MTGRTLASIGALAGALAALVPSCLMWGFTVDDALISIRYAHHLVNGAGYAFNAHAPATDGVTPLPWPFLLAPLAHGDLFDALVRAKVLGIVAWTLAGAALGARLVADRASATTFRGLLRLWPLAFVAAAFPIGAWAASGMETGLATALATFAATQFARPNRAGLLAGLAASLRPELAPWAIALAIGATVASGAGPVKAKLFPSLLAFAPSAFCMVVRVLAFGQPVPLAIAAKPSDSAHGLVYAVAAIVVGLLPLLVLAPVALRSASARTKTLFVALLVHFVVMVAVGGDWMPYARLIVPILPGLALAAADLAEGSKLWATLARSAVVGALAIYTITGAAPAGRHVHQDRAALIERARPVLASSKVVAALDIGWVGASTDATIVDLAGLTDPTIALLAGGHTSKNVDLAMLLDRHVDTVLVYTPPRGVENRLMRTALFSERFEASEKLPLGETEYVVFRTRKTPAPIAQPPSDPAPLDHPSPTVEGDVPPSNSAK